MKTILKKKTKLKLHRGTSWLVLAAMLAPYGTALAAPDQREAIRSQIEAEFERRYEMETPGTGPSIPDRILKYGADGVKEHVVDMLTDFKMGVVNGAQIAYDGNGTIVVIGAKNGWKLFKEYGEAAGIRYLDTIRMLPKKAVKIGKAFGEAGKDIGENAAENGKHTAKEWGKTADTVKDAASGMKDGAKLINELAKKGYENAGKGMADGIEDGAQDAARWAGNVYDWTKGETADAFDDLTNGTVDNVKGTARWTKRVAKFWAEETGDAISSVNDWSKAAWDFTYDATSKTWSATKHAGATVFETSTDAAHDAGVWMGKNITLPARQAKDGVVDYTKWNWRKGWTEGLKEGTETAANAWEHDDKLMATLWVMSGVGRGALHILLLEPTVVPVLATYGIAGTATLATLGYPSVGALYVGGTLAAGATYAGGTVATGLVAATGTAGTLLAGAGGGVRTAATIGTGVVATVGTAAGGTAYTVGAAGVNTVRTVGTPLVGAVGVAGAGLAGGAEMVGSVLYNSGKMAGITALAGTGYTLLTGYEAARMMFSVVQATGVTVFDNAVMTPIGVVTNLAQALATGTWTLAEDPVLGTLDVMAAGGIAVGTIVTSTGAFTYELVKGVLFGLAHGVAAVTHAGIWVIGAVAKGGEFVYTAFNIPQHRRWAAFRKEETAGVFEFLKEQTGPALASRFGNIILVRVHWWGAEKGRVRFFITKNKQTGERWFFKRVVDGKSCEVMYKVTNQDPVVRAFTKSAWAGTFKSGLFHKGCVDKRGLDVPRPSENLVINE